MSQGQGAAAEPPTYAEAVGVYDPSSDVRYPRVEHVQPGSWAADICDCWTAFPGVCCWVYWCPFVVFARVWHRAGFGSYSSIFALTAGLFLASCTVNYIAAIWSADHEMQFDNDEMDQPFVEPLTVKVLRWLSLMLIFLLWCFLVLTRVKLIRKYTLTENRCVTCLLSCCCMPCALGQQMMHVDVMEHGTVQTDCSCDANHPNAQGNVRMQ